MKRDFIIRTTIIVILVVAIIAGVSFYIIKENGKKYEIAQVKQYNYFVLKSGETSGVIDKAGNVVIESNYDDIKIPNPEKAVFVCYKDGKTTILNEQKQEKITEYQNVEPIQLKNITSELMYEKSVLKYEKDGKYGLVSLDGKKITGPIYESIEGLPYKEGELLIKKEGKFGVINIKGNELVKNIYDQITVDGYYTTDGGYKYAGYIVSNTTNEGYRYGYINYKGKLMLKPEYNQLSRTIEIDDNENAYIIASKNGQFGIMKNNEQLLPTEYQSIVYDEGNDIFTIEKSKKYGITNKEGKILVPTEYKQIDVTGIYLYAQNEQGTTVYNTEGTQVNIDTNVAILNTDNEKYKIKINNKEGTKYGVIGKNGEEIIPQEYNYVEYLHDNYFIVSNSDSRLGVIDDKNNIKIEINNDSIQKINGTDIIETITTNGNILRLYSKDMTQICEMKEANVENKNNYIKVSNNDDIKYFDKQGKELKNTEVYPNNTLFAKKVDNKWGYADKSGNMVVEAKYDMVTEFNEYGYAAVQKDDKWGSINTKGEEIVKTTYKLNDIEPSFIKSYYKVKNGLGEIYYTNNK